MQNSKTIFNNLKNAAELADAVQTLLEKPVIPQEDFCAVFQFAVKHIYHGSTAHCASQMEVAKATTKRWNEGFSPTKPTRRAVISIINQDIQKALTPS